MKNNQKTNTLIPPYKKYSAPSVSIPLELVKLEDNSFHLLVKVEIDQIQGDMIIDTGASVTVLRKR